MRNRTEVPLSNRTFSDVTAWRAIENANRGNESSQKNKLGGQKIQSPPNIITELNQQLSSLRQQKTAGEITPKEYRRLKKELTSILHETQRQEGHNPVRTRKKH